MTKKILVTGGAGYIGSHTALVLLQAGFDVIILDNLCNSSQESLRRITLITGRTPLFIQGDIRDIELLENLFNKHNFFAILHFAGLKSVGESVRNPLTYYSNNVVGSTILLQAAIRAKVFRFLFSSSATVYGTPAEVPIDEYAPTVDPSNPYGRSKLIVEDILRDLAKSDARWKIALLRYFNPIGAHESGLIGEDPRGIPNNLLPYISQVAIGKLKKLQIFGDNYPTRDGTGIRDYIHVMDLAEGHVKALQALGAENTEHGVHIWNLGTGNGVSVHEMIKVFEEISGRPVPYEVAERRTGDIAECWANPKKAERELNWAARRDLRTMLSDTWRWQSNNPNGYRDNV